MCSAEIREAIRKLILVSESTLDEIIRWRYSNAPFLSHFKRLSNALYLQYIRKESR